MNNRNTVNDRTMRMGLIGLCLGVALSMSVAFCAQPPTVEWTRTFAECGISYGYCVQPTTDGGYVVAGVTSSTSPFDSVGGAYLIRTDSLGDLVWHWTYWDFNAFSVQQTADGGFVAAGTIWLDSSPYWGAALLKTDAQGNVEWQRVISDSTPADGYSVVQTDDGGYAVAAACPAEDSGVMLVRTDSLGDSQWVKRYHIPSHSDEIEDNIIQLRRTSDKGFVMGTKTLLKVDSLGNQQWLKVYAGVSGAYSVVQTSDGGYAATGPADDSGEAERQTFLLKTDAQGNMQWMRKYAESASSRGYWLEQTADSGYAVAGATYDAGFVLRTDANGIETWSDALHPAGEARGISQPSDGGFVIVEDFYDDSANTNLTGLLKLSGER